VTSGHPLAQNRPALEEEIQKFAKEQLAPFEIPKVIEIIDQLPLTSVGKIDKKALRKIAAQ